MLVIFQILRQATNPCLVRLRGQKRNHRGEWTLPRKAALSVQNQVLVQCISRKSSKDINTIIGGQHYTLLYQYIKIYKDNITIIGRQHCV